MECFSLKQALQARLSSSPWVDKLPWVLLGLRTVSKADTDSSAAELTYGCTLHLPSVLLPASRKSPFHMDQLIQRMRPFHESVTPIPFIRHRLPPFHVPQAIQDARYEFIWSDGRRQPLQPPYEGPFKVLSKTNKFFTIQRGTSTTTVSIDRHGGNRSAGAYNKPARCFPDSLAHYRTTMACLASPVSTWVYQLYDCEGSL